MERLTLGGRGTVADRVGGRNDRSAGRHGAVAGVVHGASPKPEDVERPKSKTLCPLLGARRGWGTFNLGEAALRPAPPHRSLADQPALQGASSDWKGLRLRLTCLHGRGSCRRAVAGTPKGAAGLARHVPGRARNEPGRADAVTGQTSDRR